ncbi:MAG: RNA polymerase sigma factor [Planctomycetota bacterium]|jgi:RNA polymerase sigma-70 factor (ECF subfamily)
MSLSMCSEQQRPEGQDRAGQPEQVGVAEWVGRHQGYVWRYLRYLGCESNLAEDLAQETFLAAFVHGIPDKNPPTAQAWLRTTARNLYCAHARQVQRRGEMTRLQELDAVFEVHAHPDLGQSYLAALDQCLQLLDGRGREVLHLRYREGASRAEMATAIGLSEEGVKTLLRRVKEQLRRCIEKRRQA